MSECLKRMRNRAQQLKKIVSLYYHEKIGYCKKLEKELELERTNTCGIINLLFNLLFQKT